VIMPQSKTTLLLCLEITNQAQSLRNQYKASLLCSVCLLQILKAKVKISKSLKVKALEGMAYLVLWMKEVWVQTTTWKVLSTTHHQLLTRNDDLWLFVVIANNGGWLMSQKRIIMD
jgi:hypothetical protein